MFKYTLVAILFSISSFAHADIEVSADVTSVTPVFEYVSRQQCEYRQVESQQQVQQQRGYGGAIVGGLAGGVIGNQIGNGNGKTAATAIGAALGAITGDRMENSPQQQHQTVTSKQPVCTTVQDKIQNGYMVEYRYNQQRDVVHTKYNPGSTINLKIAPSQQ